MNDISEQIEQIQEEIRKTPYHKGTEHHIGRLRARLARLKDRVLENQIRSRSGGGGGYAIKKQGDATVVLVGPPSSGKSTLLNKLTNAESKVAPYAFTTVSVIPGMFIYRDAYIQILDVPGLIEGAQKGKGRGREVLSVARGADLLIIMTDTDRPEFIATLLEELENSGIRVNKKRPEIKIDRKLEGGINIHSNIKQGLSLETIKEIILEMGIKNAEVSLKEKVGISDLIDSLSRNRAYIPAFYLINKMDLINTKKMIDTPPGSILISAEKSMGLDKLKEEIWNRLNFIKVYLVKEDKKPNFESPIIMKRGEKIKDLLPKLGSNFEEKYTMAKIWGKSARYPGQEVPLTTPLEENLQIRFI